MARALAHVGWGQCIALAARNLLTMARTSTLVQAPLLAGTVSTICVAVHHEGSQPHELLCVQPQLLCAAQPDSMDWDAVSEALRSFLLQLHHAHHKLPAADTGASLNT